MVESRQEDPSKQDEPKLSWGWLHKYVEQDWQGNDVTKFIVNGLKPSLMDPPPNDYYPPKNAAGNEVAASIEDIEQNGLLALGASDDGNWAIWMIYPGGSAAKRFFRINHNERNVLDPDSSVKRRCPAAGFYADLADVADGKLTHLNTNKTCKT